VERGEKKKKIDTKKIKIIIKIKKKFNSRKTNSSLV